MFQMVRQAHCCNCTSSNLCIFDRLCSIIERKISIEREASAPAAMAAADVVSSDTFGTGMEVFVLLEPIVLESARGGGGGVCTCE